MMVFIYNYIQFFGLLPIFSEVAKCEKKKFGEVKFLSKSSEQVE